MGTSGVRGSHPLMPLGGATSPFEPKGRHLPLKNCYRKTHKNPTYTKMKKRRVKREKEKGIKKKREKEGKRKEKKGKEKKRKRK